MKIKISKKQWETIGNRAGWRTAQGYFQKKTIPFTAKAVVQGIHCSDDCNFIDKSNPESLMCVAFETFLDKIYPNVKTDIYPPGQIPVRCEQCLKIDPDPKISSQAQSVQNG